MQYWQSVMELSGRPMIEAGKSALPRTARSGFVVQHTGASVD